MRAMMEILDIRPLIKQDEVKATLLIILSPLLVTLHRYFGSMEVGRAWFGASSGLAPSAFMFISAFILFGIVPFVIITKVFHEHPRDFGLQLGNWRGGLGTISVLFPLIAITMLYPASKTPEITSFYPFARESAHSVGGFMALQGLRGLFFYSAWEFLFRGFMLFGLRKHLGDWMAICIQTVPQCLWHIGMPTGEILSSIVGGILFGLIAIRTQSILWPMLLHFLIGVGLDALIVLNI